VNLLCALAISCWIVILILVFEEPRRHADNIPISIAVFGVVQSTVWAKSM